MNESVLSREVDKLFTEYSFYPEADWERQGIRPPNGFDTIGAWVNQYSSLFIFLLQLNHAQEDDQPKQYFLCVLGKSREMAKIRSNILALKQKFELNERQIKEEHRTGEQLIRLQPRKSLFIVSSFTTAFFVLVNKVSEHLNGLPPPYPKLERVYRVLIGSVNIISLIILAGVFLIFAIYLAIYGWLFVKHHFISVRAREI